MIEATVNLTTKRQRGWVIRKYTKPFTKKSVTYFDKWEHLNLEAVS